FASGLGRLDGGGAYSPRPEPRAGAVGGGGVMGKAQHRDIDAGEVARVAPAQEGDRAAIGHLRPVFAVALRAEGAVAVPAVLIHPSASASASPRCRSRAPRWR